MTTRREPRTVVLATGGTGGHIYPAIATAHRLEALGLKPVFVGHAGGMEAAIVPDAGFAFHGVRAGKWSRGEPDPRQALRAAAGLWDAARLLARRRPAATVGFGGFASFPALAAARLLRVPIVLHEGNVFPGRVTRAFARSARIVAATSEATRAHLPNVRRFEVTNFPIREERVARDTARSRLGIPRDALVTLVMGGSQGSVFLNTHVPAAYRALEPEAASVGQRDHIVLHSSGPRWYDAVADAAPGRGRYLVTPYVDATLAWPAADLAITRAGVGTLAEAAFHGVPLLMVPLPSSAEDHQLHNARDAEAHGAGVVVEERDVENLTSAWQAMLLNDRRRDASRAARARSPEGAADRLARLIHDVVRGSEPHADVPSDEDAADGHAAGPPPEDRRDGRAATSLQESP